MKLKIRVIVLLGLILSGSILFAQQDPLDSLVNEAKLMIYTKPLKVIKVGDSLYNESKDIHTKITGIILITDGLISVRNYSQALEYINFASDLLPDKDNTDLRVKVLSRYSYIYFQLNLYDEALKYLDQAEKENKKIEDEKFFSNQGYILTVRALIYRNQVNCEMALKHFEQALEYFEKSPEEVSKINSSVVHYNMGSCFLNLSDYESAKKSFENAFILANIFKQNNNSLKLFAEKGLANISIAQGDYPQAIEILKMLYKDAEKINDKSLLRSISFDLASSYLELEDWDAFKTYTEINQQFDKEIVHYKKEATIIALNGLDKSQVDIIEQEKMLTQKKMLYSILFFIGISLIILWINYRKKRNIKEIYSQIFQN